MSTGKTASRKYSVKLDEQACKECGYCAAVCPKQVFSAVDYFNDKGYRPMHVTSMEKCIGCRKCFFVCPDFAIDVEKVQAKGDKA